MTDLAASRKHKNGATMSKAIHKAYSDWMSGSSNKQQILKQLKNLNASVVVEHQVVYKSLPKVKNIALSKISSDVKMKTFVTHSSYAYEYINNDSPCFHWYGEKIGDNKLALSYFAKVPTGNLTDKYVYAFSYFEVEINDKL